MIVMESTLERYPMFFNDLRFAANTIMVLNQKEEIIKYIVKTIRNRLVSDYRIKIVYCLYLSKKKKLPGVTGSYYNLFFCSSTCRAHT